MLPFLVLGNADPAGGSAGRSRDIVVEETGDHIAITTSALQARLRKQGYVSGVEGGSFVDTKTGFHDAGFRHNEGDTFSEVYLSYLGSLPSSAFLHDFAPDEAYGYRRENGKIPRRFIRAYHLRDPQTGKPGPWLAGMTLDPAVVSEAWCHQRGYVCMIEEFGGRPIQPGQSFGAVFLVGFFDSISEMNRVYDEYAGTTGLEVSAKGWKPLKSTLPHP